MLSAAGNIAVTTFDGPLMAINYARAAQTDFTECRCWNCASNTPRRAERAAIAAEIDDMAATFNDDLDVAAQRACAPDEQRLIAQIGPLVKRWRRRAPAATMPSWHGWITQIDEKFDLLIEFNHRSQLCRPPPDRHQYRQLQICQHRR